MLPFLTPYNVSNSGLGYAELFAQSSLSNRAILILMANVQNIYFCELGAWILTTCRFMTILTDHIVGVVTASAKPQMEGVDTFTVVARMANTFVGRVNAIIQPVRNAVCAKFFMILVNDSIATLIQASLPVPTPIGLHGNPPQTSSKWKIRNEGDKFELSHDVFSYIENKLVRLAQDAQRLVQAVFIIPQMEKI